METHKLSSLFVCQYYSLIKASSFSNSAISEAGAKFDVQLEQVSPEWQLYNQHERVKPIRGGHRWRVVLPAKKPKTLSVNYKIKTFVDNELIGGNRRE